MEFSDVTSLVKEDLVREEEALKTHYKSEIALIPGISGYLMDGGGKRIRPLLVLLSTKLFGEEIGERTIKHACAVEYIHAATLLHDDVVDETTVRRGNETVNSKWGSDASILVGDYLVSKAILLLAYDSDPRIIQAIAESAKVLVEGVILEFTNVRKLDVTEDYYLEVIYRKTASIISVSCQVGALFAQADKEMENAMISFGDHIGTAFQLVDDVMDYDGNEELLGKPVGTDFKEGHVTLPLLYLYENADKSLKNEIEGFIKNENLTHKELEYITDRMREVKAIEYTLDKARDHIEKAKEILYRYEFKSPLYRDALAAVADFIIDQHTVSKACP
ncbi:MAG: polyprenyl synthetase family protein [Nitrospinales bacterium]